MKLNEKKQKIEEIKKSLSYREIKNIGTMFFGYHSCGQVLRDTVYFGAKRIGIDFEVIDMTSSYFVGSKEHAVALQEAFGGKAYATEYVAFSQNSLELYAWEGPQRNEQCQAAARHQEVVPLDFDEVVSALF